MQGPKTRACIYAANIAISKDFDTVGIVGLRSCPEPLKFYATLLLLSSLMAKSFPVSNSIRQGCVLASPWFSVYFDMML